MTRAVIASAKRVTPLQFLDGIGLSSPEKRAARDEHNRIEREGTAEEKEAYRKAMLEQAIADYQARADALTEDTQLTECRGHPLLRRVA